MDSMALCPLLYSKPLSAYSLKTSSDRWCQMSTFYPRRVARVASVATKQGRSVVVPDVKQSPVADLRASHKTKGDGK